MIDAFGRRASSSRHWSNALGRGEAMPDRQHRLADDRQGALKEQVVRLCDRARERAFDRENAVPDLRRHDRIGNGAEARERHERL